MKQMKAVVSLIITSTLATAALAVGPEKKLEFPGSSMGTVVFDGSAHKNAGLTCKDCHNPAVFPAMKQGGVKITMNDLYAGKYCGRCHDGKQAFQILGNCARCHHKT